MNQTLPTALEGTVGEGQGSYYSTPPPKVYSFDGPNIAKITFYRDSVNTYAGIAQVPLDDLVLTYSSDISSEPDSDGDGYFDYEDICPGYGTFENWGCSSKTEWCQIEYGSTWYADEDGFDSLCYPDSGVSSEPDADGDGTPDYADTCPSTYGEWEYWGCTSWNAFCAGEFGSTYYYDEAGDYCADSADIESGSDFPEPSAEFMRLWEVAREAGESGNCNSATNYINQASALGESFFDAAIKYGHSEVQVDCVGDLQSGLNYLEQGLVLAKANNYPEGGIENFEIAIADLKQAIADASKPTSPTTPEKITPNIIPKIKPITPGIPPKLIPTAPAPESPTPTAPAPKPPILKAPTPTAPAPTAPAPTAPAPTAPTPSIPKAPIPKPPILKPPTSTTPTAPITPVTLSIDTDRSTYNQGNLVTIRSDISGVTSNANIAISVTDPSGNIVLTRSLFTDDTGSIPFKIPHGTTAGSYKVSASVRANGQNYEDTSQFTVQKSLAGLSIKSVSATDQQGNQVDSFSKGNQGYIKIVLSADSSMSNSLVTVTVFDLDFTALGTSSIKTLITSADSEIILSFYIPDDTSDGNANIYVNAFSDWPSNGGIPLTREGSAVIGIFAEGT